jgi:serine/threonine-protein kinase
VIGKTLGNYRITQRIGQGGFGEVWKAVDLTLDRDVVLKILRPEIAAQDGVVARFRTEALALARLNHPNVATIHGFQTEGGVPFIVMEYIPGQTLHVIVRGFGPMQTVRALPLFFHVLDAIEHAHDHGIVHRDLKASNVMMTHQGVVKLLDFGIARVPGSAQLTQGPRSLGTPAWMAPEQVRGQEADVRTDVYALGLLLYWLVTARLPFEGGNDYELQRAHAEEAPPPPRQFAPTLPEAIEKSILRALAKERTERFANVGEMRLALGEAFVPALTIPFLSSTMDDTLPRARNDAYAEALAKPSEWLPQSPAVDLPAPTVQLPHAADADTPVRPNLALPVSAPQTVASPRAPRSRWLPFAIATLLLAFAVVAAGVRSLRHPAASLSEGSGGLVAERPDAVVAVPAKTLPEQSGPELAAAPPPESAAAPKVPNPKRKAATPRARQGEDGWVIKRE